MFLTACPCLLLELEKLIDVYILFLWVKYCQFTFCETFKSLKECAISTSKREAAQHTPVIFIWDSPEGRGYDVYERSRFRENVSRFMK